MNVFDLRERLVRDSPTTRGASSTSATSGCASGSIASLPRGCSGILLDLDSGIPPRDHFNAGPEDQHWYYHSLADAFATHAAGPLATEFARVVDPVEAHISRPVALGSRSCPDQP